jgi:inner membrane protein
MPSPISHTAMGYVVYKVFNNRIETSRKTSNVFSSLFIIVVVLSLLPDFDAIPGILVGNLKRFHNNESHSLFVAVGIAILGAIFMRWSKRENFRYWFLLIFSCVGLHIVMDYFTYGRGVMAFWPLSSERFISPVLLFYGLHWSEGIFSVKHLWTIVNETIFVLITLLVMRSTDFARRKRNGSKASVQGEK